MEVPPFTACITCIMQTNFNTSNVEVPLALSNTEEQDSFNFNTSNVEVPQYLLKVNQICREQFQYIQCGGSAAFIFSEKADKFIFQYIQCGGSAEQWQNNENEFEIFQYIQCGGSAINGLEGVVMEINFNTSNVEVPLNIPTSGSNGRTNFNTSNVEVPHSSNLSINHSVVYFNTSNVEVPPRRNTYTS